MDLQLTEKFQKTIASENEIQGIGLHSGQDCRLRVLPSDSGKIVFCRTDLNRREVPASWQYHKKSSLNTCLEKEGVEVKTVEHFMSALNALKIDSLLIELNSPELPILDGSALQWFQFLKNCKTKTLQKTRKFFTITTPIKVGDAENYASFSPAKKQTFHFFIEFEHPLIQKQSFLFTLNEEDYKKQIAAARTFGFEKDKDKLIANGLIKGVNYQNAIVLAKNGSLLNKENLRFNDEFVRHKILDSIGDLYLGESHIIGSYYGHKSSHAINLKLLQKIFTTQKI